MTTPRPARRALVEVPSHRLGRWLTRARPLLAGPVRFRILGPVTVVAIERPTEAFQQFITVDSDVRELRSTATMAADWNEVPGDPLALETSAVAWADLDAPIRIAIPLRLAP